MMRRLNNYVAGFNDSLYVHAADAPLFRRSACQKPQMTYESFVLDLATRCPRNCLSNYISLQTIYYLRATHVLFSPQFRSYYEEHGPHTADLLYTRLFVRRAKLHYFTGPVNCAQTSPQPRVLLDGVNCKRRIQVCNYHYKMAKKLISSIPLTQRILQTLPLTLDQRLGRTILHKMLYQPLKMLFAQDQIKQLITLLYEASAQELNVSEFKDYTNLLHFVVIPYLSQFFAFHNGTLFQKRRLSHKTLRLHSVPAAGEESCAVVSVMPKSHDGVRAVFKTSANEELLGPLALLFTNEQFFYRQLHQIKPGATFYDMDNAFNEVDLGLLFSLLQSQIASYPADFLLIYEGLAGQKYPVRTEIISPDELLKRLREHLFGFKFYDPFAHRVFLLQRGLPQGSGLSPLLFKVYADFVVARATVESFMLSNNVFQVLKYVDNLVVQPAAPESSNALAPKPCEARKQQLVARIPVPTRRIDNFCTYRADLTQKLGGSRGLKQLLRCSPNDIEDAVKKMAGRDTSEAICKTVCKRISRLRFENLPCDAKLRKIVSVCRACKSAGLLRSRVRTPWAAKVIVWRQRAERAMRKRKLRSV